MSDRGEMLRGAAFGTAPPIAEPALLALAAETRVSTHSVLVAIVCGARGRYALANSLLDPLIRGRNPLLASLAGSVLASHRRQLGGHSVARSLDGAALRNAVHANGPGDDDGLDPRGAVVDALLGLAADNLALGKTTAARLLVNRSMRLATSWRSAVRTGWVRAELALATATPEEAVGPAQRALGIARARGSLRHSIKSELVLSAALAATGDPGARRDAVDRLERVLSGARTQKLLSLVWPGEALAEELGPVGSEDRHRRRTRVLHDVLLHADPIGRHLASVSPWVPV